MLIHRKVGLYELPIVNLDAPALAAKIDTSDMVIRGWGFYPDHKDLRFDVWIDREKRGSCRTGEPRPDVGKAFPVFPHSQNAGFSITISVKDLYRGQHQLWLSANEDQIPSNSIYFIKG